MRTCDVCGQGPVVGRGLCRKHYQRAWVSKSLDSSKLKMNLLPPRTRLMSKFRVSDKGCWEWQGATNHSGYGTIYADGKVRKTHRLSYEFSKGPIPDGIDVLHQCDNPLCINPDHLFLGTRADNVKDAASKNRLPLNERHWNTKLSVEDVSNIRKSTLTKAELAREYKVNRSTIVRVINGTRRSKTI